MKTLPASAARARLYQLVQTSILAHTPIRISSKTGNAILLSEQEYESLLETAELLATPGLTESILEAEKDMDAGNFVQLDALKARMKPAPKLAKQ